MKSLLKKAILLLCLGTVTACAISYVNNLHSLTLYEYHMQASLMESQGAQHFPEQVPSGAKDVLYSYTISDNEEIYQLSFSYENLDDTRLTDLNSSSGNAELGSISSITRDSDSQRITYYHRRWQTRSADTPIEPMAMTDELQLAHH